MYLAAGILVLTPLSPTAVDELEMRDRNGRLFSRSIMMGLSVATNEGLCHK